MPANEQTWREDVTKKLEKLEEHDRRFDAMDRRFDAMDRRFDAMDSRFNKIEDETRHSRILQEDFAAKLNQVLDITLQTHERLARYDRIEPKVEDHEYRISALETSKRRHSKKKQAPRQ